MAENDVFVSYAHIDNQPLVPDQEGWVSSFHHSLKVRLGQLLGREPRVWRDPKLQGNDDFAGEIADRFASVSTMVSVLSPRYVRSEWCLRELTGFLDAKRRGGDLTIANKSRLFKVTKTPIPLESQPEEIRGLLGYDFFSLDPETERVREYNLFSGPERERKYWSALDDLASDIARLLESEAAAAEGAPAPAMKSPAEGSGKRVFLAEATFGLREARDAVKRDLVQRGYTVEPQEALPPVASEIARRVPEILARCQLSVHLMGKSYGVVPEGANHSLADLQNRLSIERAAGAGFDRVVWIQPGVEAEDERQRSLLQALRTDPATLGGADLFETSLEELKAAILGKLAPKVTANGGSRAAAAGGDGPSLVYLICDRKDIDEVRTVGDLLYDRGLEVALPIFEGEASEVRTDHEENLKICDAVLIYYGHAKSLWLRSKLRELKKIAGYGRTEPMRAKAILVAQPASPEKEQFRTHEAVVIKCPDSLSVESLEPFLAAVEA
ncbi:MAG: toll/interleukin-1 receptor domain-containing protein [Acidobacteriota bacterium]|nr:toll/interleukin-1 receptor domain-containing protein [Acidobacteriota bacterium]MDH3522099.1 toll/interleukin-1 receptor domain-containing protein [Acidobacteriota bacterium]